MFLQDAEFHGSDKHLSVTIALLEKNTSSHHIGEYLLRFTAATSDLADHVLGNALYKDTKGIR